MQINGISLWRKFIPQDIVENHKESASEDSLVVQWLGLHASTAGAWVASLVKELSSHKLHGTGN